MHRLAFFLVLTALASVSTTGLAQSVPAAIFTDPPADATHPAKMTVLHIPSHGLLINGVIYQPAGAGLHPALVIFHGLPGNKRTSILGHGTSRRMRTPSPSTTAARGAVRASTASPENLEDADAVLAYLRDPATAARLGSIPNGSPSPATAWEAGWSRTPPLTITH